jgi:intein/homing endonuclease
MKDKYMNDSIKKDVYRLQGYLGILAKKLKVDVQLDMQERLTLQMKSWNDAPSLDVEGFYKKDGYFWVPRFYFKKAINKKKLGNHDIKFEWNEGSPTNLPFNAILDPKRGQPIAVDRMVDHIKKDSGGILVAATGCISGDTHINFEFEDKDGRHKGSNGALMSELYKRFNGLYQKATDTSRKSEVDFFVPSATDDYVFRLNKIIAVIDSGEKFVFRVTTNSGKCLKATADHEIMTEKGFIALEKLSVGDMICIHSSHLEHKDKPLTTPCREEVVVKYHPTAKVKYVNGWAYQRLSIYQAIFEADQNDLSYDAYIAALNGPREDLPPNMWTTPIGHAVYHIDENYENNSIENLALVKHQDNAINNHNGSPEWFVGLDSISSIEAIGVEHVYDIKCNRPYHNFVAGGIVVHNCGKTILGYAIGQRLNTTIGVLVYNSHMVKNWVDTAKWLFDLSDDDIGIVQRDRCDLGRPVTIMMVQSLLSEKVYPRKLYEQFGIIIADECVTGDSLVETDVGKVTIENIPISGASSVLCYDDRHATWVYRSILRWVPKGEKKTLVIKTREGSQIRCTPEHLIRATTGWTRADRLAVGDKVLSPQSSKDVWITNFLMITSVEEDSNIENPVFDLEIAEHHSFIANGFLVHNCNRYGAPQWNQVLRKFPTRYRLALSADPTRDDGLDKLVEWHFGEIAHKVVMETPKPDVIQVFYKKTYPIGSYTDRWKRTPSGNPMPNPLKYDKLLAQDDSRNRFLIEELVKMRKVGRRILVFSRLKDHLILLKQMFEDEIGNSLLSISSNNNDSKVLDVGISVTLLVGGLKKGKLDDAMAGDVIFTTYAFGRDAMNVPHIDTLLFATPPGKPLQPIGRLRDKGPTDRRPLMGIDPYENCDYSIRKAERRSDTYMQLGIKVTRIIRNPR